jgi:predicted transcriptional regulator
MSATQVNFNPSNLSSEQVRLIARAVAIDVKDILTEKPATLEEIAEYLGRSVRHINRLKNAGDLKAHYLPGDKRPYFLKSEILQKIKES